MDVMRAARYRMRAFTLIELLVVITVIAILMALLFPAFKGVQDQAKRTQAKNDATQIVTAVNAYYTEYGKMPIDVAAHGANDVLFGDPGGSFDNKELMDPLRALNDVLNPKKITFLQFSNVKDADNPRGGILTKDVAQNGWTMKTGSLVDPWGGEYLVTVDSDYDNWSQQFFAYSDLGYTTINGGAGSWPSVQTTTTAATWGKDFKFGTNGDSKFKESDDVISWQ
jgi:prepilin-type N-terminal cleavage/methylation domain-containing protein